jgi:uncharacterized RmlC-like cupin family protein
MTRREALSAKTVGSSRLWMGQTHAAARTASGDHHHGEAETAIYVLSGHIQWRDDQIGVLSGDAPRSPPVTIRPPAALPATGPCPRRPDARPYR